MSKSFVNCHTHTDIKCWTTYKWILRLSQMCENWLWQMTTPCLSLVPPCFEKVLMGSPCLMHKTASSKQGQAMPRWKSYSHTCLLWVQLAMGRKEQKLKPTSTHSRIQYSHPVNRTQSTIPNHPFGETWQSTEEWLPPSVCEGWEAASTEQKPLLLTFQVP